METADKPAAARPLPTGSEFEQHVGDTFCVALDNGTDIDLTLSKFTHLGGKPGSVGGGRPGGSFSLVFIIPGQSYLPQGMYTLDHTELGRLEIFLVPVGPDKKNQNMQHEAVFN